MNGVCPLDREWDMAGFWQSKSILAAASLRATSQAAAANPRTGAATATDVLPGTPPMQVIHDENDDRALGHPVFPHAEAMGFLHETPVRFGPPRREDAWLEPTGGGATVPLSMRYLQ